MVVFAIRPVSPVTRTVRAVRSDKPDEVETASDPEEPTVRAVPGKPKASKREGKAFYQSAVSRSSGGVQGALIGLQKGG